MAKTDIKLEDDYIIELANELESWGNDLQTAIDKYIQILNNILTDAIIEGETANALEEFAGYAEALKDTISGVGKEAKGMCFNYLIEVDRTDEELY